MTPTSKNYSKGYPRSEDIRWYHHPVPPVLVSSFFDSYQVYVYMKSAYIICNFYVYKYIHTYIHRYDITWMRTHYPIHLGSLGVCLPWHQRRLKVGHSGTITCAAISPDASFVVSTGSEAGTGEPEKNGTTGRWTGCGAFNNTERGEWMVGENNDQKMEQPYFLGKKDGCFWIRNNAAMFLGWPFFSSGRFIQKPWYQSVFFLGASETNGTPHMWSPESTDSLESTDPAREPSSFGQCHKSWLRSAMSLSEWTVGEWFLADRTFLLAKSFP